MTLKDKLNLCNNGSQIMKYIPNSDLVLTSTEKNLKPFWNSSIMEMSKNLWLPIKIDSADLDQIWSNSSLKRMEGDSWFSMSKIYPQNKNLFMTLPASSILLAPDSIPLETTKKKSQIESIKNLLCQEEKCQNQIYQSKVCNFHLDLLKNSNTCIRICRSGRKKGTRCTNKVKNELLCGLHSENKIKKDKIELKSRTIKLNIKKNQINELRHWFGASRKYYNTAIRYMNNKNNKIYGLANIRPIVIDRLSNKKYLDNIPFSIKSESVSDACKAISNAIEKYKKTKKFQQCTFRSKKDTSQSISFDYRDIKIINDKTFKLYGKIIKTNELLPKIDNSCRIIMKHNKYFYLSIPVPIESYNTIKTDKVVALDPGVRTFQSFYSPDICGKIGHNASSRIYQKCLKIDKLQSKIDLSKNKFKEEHGKKRKSLRRYINILKHLRSKRIQKIKNLKNELHWKTCNYLVKNFDIIYLPKFESQDMIGKLHSKVSRSLCNLSHYTFQQRLLHKSKEYKKKVVIVTEEYTSQTCGCCGKLTKTTSETYKCKNCEIILDRDINGSRNILLKNILLESR